MAKYTFEVTAGTYTSLDGELFQTGDEVESNIELDKMFRNKFKRLGVPVESSKKKKPAPLPEPEEVEEEVAEAEEVETANTFGENVTDRFPSAVENGYLVFFAEQFGYTVTTQDEPTAAINGMPLKTKTKLTKFLEANKV